MQFLKEITYSNNTKQEVNLSLKTHKIVLLRGCNRDNLYSFYDKLSDEIGHWVPMDEDLATGEKTGSKWIEIRYEPSLPNSYRHSSTGQPLHTDGSYESNAPDITFFFCIKAAPAGGATFFVNSDDLLKYLELYSGDLARRCRTHPLKFGKGSDSKTRTIISEDEKGVVLTWNYFRVLEQSTTDMELREEFHTFLENKIIAGGLCYPVQLMPGDAVFFHDERVLHGRFSFIANKAGDRNLLKGGICLT